MSENSNRNKNLLLAIAGAGLLLGAAILYSWSTHEEEEESIDLAAELKAQQLDKAKKSGPILEGQYFLFLLNFIGVHSATKMAKKKKTLDAERRGFLKKKDSVNYTASVEKMIQLRE